MQCVLKACRSAPDHFTKGLMYYSYLPSSIDGESGKVISAAKPIKIYQNVKEVFSNRN